MGKFKGYNNLKKEKNNKTQIEIQLVSQYKNAILNNFNYISNEFDFNGEKNILYVYDKINFFRDEMNKKIYNYSIISSLETLKSFHVITTNLVQYFYGFFAAINLYVHDDSKSEQHILINLQNIDLSFKKLGQFDLVISKFENIEQVKISQNYCLEIIKEAENFIYNHLFINISVTPFRNDFCNVIYLIQNVNSNFNYLEQKNISTFNNISGKLKMNDIALREFYLGNIITLENAHKFLLGTGLKSERDLYNTYIKFSDRKYRRSNPENSIKLKNRIKLFEKVRELLPIDKRITIDNDLEVLKSYD